MDIAGPTTNSDDHAALLGRIPVKPIRSRMLAAGNSSSRKPVIRMEFRLEEGRARCASPKRWQKITAALPILPPAVMVFGLLANP